MSFIYTGSKTKEISFPLGGIGTGSLGLAGNGRLMDWEIFNRPNKGSLNGFTHFAVKAQEAQSVLDARVLQGDLLPPYSGALNGKHFNSYGFGSHRGTLAGVPHFQGLEFCGEFPIAELRFRQDSFPGSVRLSAFNPFIPLDSLNSSIPAAFFEVQIVNTTDKPLLYTVCLSVSNPFEPGSTVNHYSFREPYHLIKLGSNKHNPDEIGYGDLTVATDAEEVSYQEYWYRGRWFDELGVFWREFSAPGRLKNRRYGESEGRQTGDTCSLAVHLGVAPGQSGRSRFLLSWNVPNCHNYWKPAAECGGEACCSPEKGAVEKGAIWKNYYATVFKDSAESALYGLKNWDNLYSGTRAFKETLFSSSLPRDALQAVAANISILKSPTCLRLEDGSFYGFEGCHCDSGCCEGSCTHVWNYAYALPFLFPDLERSMRELDFKYNQGEDGSMSFRLQLPLGRERSAFRPCADGQFGGIIKTYREWKISGDSQWLGRLWPQVKKCIDFAWAESNTDRWDMDRRGVLAGRQHHTLDMELFGPNSWLSGFYLAALKAGSEMAGALGDTIKAREYRELFEKGKRWVDKNLFNGEYYHQRIDLKDRSILESYAKGETITGDPQEDLYWNREYEELNYQIGEGCEIDQVLAQWHANICGLGEIFDPNQTRQALQSIYRYNFKKSRRDFFNPCRIFSVNDEGGVIICAWPEGKYKPVIPLTYAEETMNGFEYQVAAHLIQEGFIEQGLEIVSAIRQRYDGEKRNPWNEFECGSNYARSMASYALLLACSGFEFDMTRQMIGFNPIGWEEGDYKIFWSIHEAWGSLEISKNEVRLNICHGQITLKELGLPFLKQKGIAAVLLGKGSLEFEERDGRLSFATAVTLKRDAPLTVQYRP